MPTLEDIFDTVADRIPGLLNTMLFTVTDIIFLHISELNNYTGNLLTVVLAVAHYTHS